jgi:hypothetical protein
MIHDPLVTVLMPVFDGEACIAEMFVIHDGWRLERPAVCAGHAPVRQRGQILSTLGTFTVPKHFQGYAALTHRRFREQDMHGKL